jgi:hypothetical protein
MSDEPQASVSFDSCKAVAICKHCRMNQKNPTLEINFFDEKIYWLCQSCSLMNMMDLSKPLPSSYPRTKRM